MTSAPLIVRVDNLSFSYPTGQALRNVSLEARAGEIVGILGPNGSGKSTFFHILSTILVPSEGKVELAGNDVLANPDQARRDAGIVFQTPGLDKKLTVTENLRYHGQLYGLSGEFLENRMEHVLGTFGLSDRRNHLVETLSGGQQRRADLARGMLHQPRMLILDEPSTGLDPSARLEFWHFLKDSVAETGMAVMLTTHLLDEADRCDRVAIIDKGQLVAMGSPAELKRSIGTEVVVIVSKSPEQLERGIRRRLGLKGTVIEKELHLETDDGSRLLPRIAAFADRIDSLTVRKPSLEDVFLRKTGHRLSNGSGGVSR